MTDEQNPIDVAVDQALDAFVYAPIGFVLDGPSSLGKAAANGRNQVKAARMFGEFAVKMGKGELSKRLAPVDTAIRDAIASSGLLGRSTASTASVDADSSGAETTVGGDEAPTTPASDTATDAAPAATELAIPDYDSLSASQVVSRLRGLSPADLEAVRLYESAKRARKTILGKVQQLQKR